MAQKRLLLLGGLRYLLPVIESAKAEGYYVITCDYLPDNIAHKYSDEYHNVSITDSEAVLALARELKIDGIMSFAVDPGVVTAAYTAERLGLPFAGSYEAVKILQNKDLFRKFLTDNGFNVPASGGYTSVGDIRADLGRFTFPLIVKPVDSAGSKGVTKVCREEELDAAFARAMEFSRGGRVIVEEFIEKAGCSSDTDSFSLDGRLRVVTFNSQRFDDEAANPYAPSAYSWPSTFTAEQEEYLRGELQRLVTLLGLKTSIYNIETRIGTDGKPYIMEVSPRGGGNRLAEMIRYATGTDIIRAAVRAAVGDPIDEASIVQRDYDGHWAEIVLHSEADGVFCGVEISGEMQPYVVETDLWVSEGDRINAFRAANDAIGTLVMKFGSERELLCALSGQKGWLKVKVERDL